MSPNEILYTSLLLATTFFSLFAIALVWKRHNVPGVKPLMVFLGAIALWSSTYAIFWMNLFPSREFWLNVTYFGVVAVVPSFFVFVMRFTHQGHWLNRYVWALLIIEPVLTLLLLWTDSRHGLFFSGRRNISDTSLYAGGPFFWFNVAYNYLLYLFAMMILIRQIRFAKFIYRHQLKLILISSFIPWCTSFASFIGLNPLPTLDPTPIALSFVGLITIYSIIRYRFLELVPIARDTLIEQMNDGVMVVDNRGYILDVNRSMGEILGQDAQSMLGAKAATVFPECEFREEELARRPAYKEEIIFRKESSRYLNIRLFPLFGKKQAPQGWLLIARDISAQKTAEIEQEKLIKELREALSQVKQLRGMLPICASCHKIRDDQGYWQNVEVYIREHSEAEFSHGICPDCASKLYPDLTDEDRAAKDH
ncbi:MAG: hypothetical protein Kow0037_13110 [Calditrichia bacterium]